MLIANFTQTLHTRYFGNCVFLHIEQLVFIFLYVNDGEIRVYSLPNPTQA